MTQRMAQWESSDTSKTWIQDDERSFHTEESGFDALIPVNILTVKGSSDVWLKQFEFLSHVCTIVIVLKRICIESIIDSQGGGVSTDVC